MFKPWYLIPPKLAHDMAPLALQLYSSAISEQNCAWRSFSWRPRGGPNLFFRNRMGIAGGVDKNGELIPVWKKLGAGFIEIGTVTPLPQGPNPGTIIDRDTENLNLWNKMGFPNKGMEELFDCVDCQLRKIEDCPPLFINLGKNRNTSLEDAHLDYAKLAARLYPLADAFVINISSPNTQGLRSLQTASALEPLIASVRESVPHDHQKPVLVKLSPDMEASQLESTIAALMENSVDGIILTNTTLSRPANSPFSTEGGVSGAFLKDISKKQLTKAVQFLGNHKSKVLLVSVGGLLTPQDIAERLELGADLVQIYSALVFKGPAFFREVCNYMNEERE
ncbi:MAG: quinone-dependent dihydroorotate dehydrogenase [Pseudobdellovibrionaceae bacterium]